ncbi:hypothetical protein Tco_0057730 [Tanacetum coccineum]
MGLCPGESFNQSWPLIFLEAQTNSSYPLILLANRGLEDCQVVKSMWVCRDSGSDGFGWLWQGAGEKEQPLKVIRGFVKLVPKGTNEVMVKGFWVLTPVRWFGLIVGSGKLRMERLNLGNSPTANIKGKGDVIHIWKRVDKIRISGNSQMKLKDMKALVIEGPKTMEH